MENVPFDLAQIIEAFWFILPAYAGNVTPLFVKWLPLANVPVDSGKSIGGKRIFGDHKTWRGIITGVTVGAIVGFIQGRPPAYGAILALGNFAGDLVGACIKRQYNIPPGGSSLLVDSIPSPFFALLAAYISGFLSLSIWQSMLIVLSIVPLHLMANRLWYILKLKSVSW